MTVLTLKEILQRLPKSELHLHLRGAIPPQVFADLLNKYSAREAIKDAPDHYRRLFQQHENIRPFLSERRWAPEDVKELFRFRDFERFLHTYHFTSYFFREAADLRALIGGVLDSLRAQNVVYAEITVELIEYLRRGIALEEVGECLNEAARQGGRASQPDYQMPRQSRSRTDGFLSLSPRFIEGERDTAPDQTVSTVSESGQTGRAIEERQKPLKRFLGKATGAPPSMNRGDNERSHVGLAEGRMGASAEMPSQPGIRVQWIVDLVRNIGPEEALALLKRVIALRCESVVGITLGGNERDFPPAQFAQVYSLARDHGLHRTVHAGEALGPESVWDAVRILGAERIGHGVRAIEDSSLVAYLAEKQISLEVCPTSNLRTGIYSSYAEHPLKALYEAGVPVTINSDDPTFFGTTLTDELLRAHEMGLSREAIGEIVDNGFAFAFLARTLSGVCFQNCR